MIFQENMPKKQVEVGILISIIIDVQPKLIKTDRELHLLFFKRQIHQNGISILTIYASKGSISACVKEILLNLKLHIELHTIIVGDFNTQLLPSLTPNS